ncbi:hexokinase [Coemansia sp. RSA 2336]|nr:hexokinase [Coemansia sp. RSA 2336]
MYRGLASNPLGRASELSMNPTLVHQPGTAQPVSLGMAIDATGKRIRIGSIHGDQCLNTQVFYPPSKENIFDFAAFCIREFLQQHKLEGTTLPLGVTIGLPVDSACPDTAKEDSLDLCGSDVGRKLHSAILRNRLPVHVTSVTNNVVSELIAARHHDKATRVAATFNRGINAAYFEKLANVERLNSSSSSDIAINTEVGRFGENSLPRTMWDRRVDRESRCPHTRALEKLVADQYLGEIVRNLITDFMDRQLLFPASCHAQAISTAYAFHTAYMAPIMEDTTEDLGMVDALFATEFDIHSSLADRLIIRALCEIVAARAARLAGAVLAALVLKAASTEPIKLALSGGLFTMNSQILDTTKNTLKDIFYKR